MRSLKGDSVSLRLAYDNKDKTLNQSTNQQWEKTENGQNTFELSRYNDRAGHVNTIL